MREGDRFNSERRPSGVAAALAALGLAVNFVAVPVPGAPGAGMRLGGAASLVAAALFGPVYGVAVAALASLPLVATPWLVAATVAAAAVAGAVARRGHFVTPAVTLAWSVAGSGLVWLAPGSAGHAFAAFLAGAVGAVVADLVSVLAGARLGAAAAPRRFGPHLALPLSVAAISGPVLVGLVYGEPVYGGALGAAAAAAGVAAGVAAVLGARVGRLLGGALEPGAGPSSPALEIDELRSLRERAAARDAELAAERDALRQQLAEKEDAYSELLRLSERLEERLQLRGVEVEQREFLLSLSQRQYQDVVEQASDIIFSLDLEGRFVEGNGAAEGFFAGRDYAGLAGRRWLETLAPGFDGSRGSFAGADELREYLLAHERFEGTTVHRDACGEIRLLDTKLELVTDEAGLPLRVNGLSHDVTELAGLQRQVRELGEAFDRARVEAKRRDLEIDALLNGARVLNSELEIDQLLQHIIESAAALIGAESGFVGLLDEGALTLSWYWRATGASWIDLEEPRVERGVTAIVLETRRPYLCADAAADPHTDKEFTAHFGVRSMLVVPIFSQASEVLGAMALHNFPVEPARDERAGIGLEATEMRFLEGLADIASAAIQQSRLFEQVRRQAETDSLTGLFNRRAFDARFAREVDRSSRTGRPFALVLVDLDHLKVVNDTFGHPIGDAAICSVADVLRDRVRRNDFAARIGGEEFAVLLADGRAGPAMTFARGLVDAIRRREVPRAGRVTASVGVALFPEDAADPEALYRLADEALYRAKNGGRDRAAKA